MEPILKVKSRTELGRKTKTLRRAGFLPAVVYGEGMESKPLAVPYKDFEKVYREAGESTLVTLDLDGKKYNVLIQETARDPLKDTFLHADFYAVRMDKAIRTKVPIEFLGESPAVKSEGGVLVKVMQEVEVEALAQDLPHELRIDISGLQALESKLHVKNILLPKGVKILAGPDEIVVLVETPRTEEEVKAVTETPAEAPLEVKTEREVKQELKKKAEEETTEVS